MTSDTLNQIVEARRLAETGRAREIRLAGRLSTRELAKAVGVDPKTITRWEEGKTKPKGDQAVRWVEGLRAVEAGLREASDAETPA